MITGNHHLQAMIEGKMEYGYFSFSVSPFNESFYFKELI